MRGVLYNLKKPSVSNETGGFLKAHGLFSIVLTQINRITSQHISLRCARLTHVDRAPQP